MEALSWAPDMAYPAHMHNALQAFAPIMETLPINERESFIDDVIDKYECGSKSVAKMMTEIYCSWKDTPLTDDERALVDKCIEPLRLEDTERLVKFEQQADVPEAMQRIVENVTNFAILTLSDQSLLQVFQRNCQDYVQQNPNIKYSEMSAHISNAAKVLESDAGWQYFLRANNYQSSSDLINFFISSRTSTSMLIGGVALHASAANAIGAVSGTLETMSMENRAAFAKELSKYSQESVPISSIVKNAFTAFSMTHDFSDITQAAFEEDCEFINRDEMYEQR